MTLVLITNCKLDQVDSKYYSKFGSSDIAPDVLCDGKTLLFLIETLLRFRWMFNLSPLVSVFYASHRLHFMVLLIGENIV